MILKEAERDASDNALINWKIFDSRIFSIHSISWRLGKFSSISFPIWHWMISQSFASIGSILKMSTLWIFVTTPPALNPETEFAWVATKREIPLVGGRKISFGILVGSRGGKIGCRAGNRSVGEVVIIPRPPHPPFNLLFLEIIWGEYIYMFPS